MKIVSWNVNGIRACHKKGCFNWFFENSPDIFCLQEIKADPDQVPAEMKSPPGYHAFFDTPKEKKGYSGVAVYTKIQPETVSYGIGIDEFDREGRCIGIKYKNFWLFNVYFPNGGGGPHRLKFKLDFYKVFLKHIEVLRAGGEEIIFCGDINTAHKPEDLARPKENENNTGFLPIEREWLDEITSLGYIDTFRFFHPDAIGKYTFWDQKTFARERNVGWRIDYFFTSPNLKKHLISSDIFNNVYGSDHCPIGLFIKNTK